MSWGEKREHPFGEKRDYPKIDIFVNGQYVASTTWSKTCKDAAERLREKQGLTPGTVKAFFSRD